MHTGREGEKGKGKGERELLLLCVFVIGERRERGKV